MRSPLLKTILNTICGGDYRRSKPNEIRIYDDRVEGIYVDHTYKFDFTINRVPHLEAASSIGGEDCEEFVLRPQIALANAINSITGGEYEITDCAFHNYFDDGDYSYHSCYVCMHLKPNNYF